VFASRQGQEILSLTRIQGVPASNIHPVTEYPDESPLSFYSISPGKYLDSASNCATAVSLRILSDSIFNIKILDVT
jgi:hypothetical protein